MSSIENNQAEEQDEFTLSLTEHQLEKFTLSEKELKSLKVWEARREVRYQARLANELKKENRDEKFKAFKMNKRIMQGVERKKEHDELYILFDVLKGLFLESIAYGVLNNDINFRHTTFVDFLHSKRPFGNKDVEASIAYHLGWNYDYATHTRSQLTEEVRAEAMRLFRLLEQELTLKTGSFSYDVEHLENYANHISSIKLVSKEGN